MHIESSFDSQRLSFLASQSCLKSMNTINSGNELAISSPSQLNMFPRLGVTLTLSFFTEIQALPIFKLGKFASGFHYEEFNARQRPYGSLAQRTLGDMFGAKDTARCGLELTYDSILRGSNGITHRRKVLNKFLDIMDTPPIDGADIVTTIDVSMQDLAERSVINELKEINGNVGVAIVMEVATGDVKAIVNMEKCVDGNYREIKNHAVSDLLEPGSVFKMASIFMVDCTYPKIYQVRKRRSFYRTA